MFWGNDEEQRRKRQQEEDTKRKREEQAKKARQEAAAKQKAKAAKKRHIEQKKKKAEWQKSMDEEIGGMMEDFGSERPGYENKDQQQKTSNTLARGVMSQIFGGSGMNNNWGNFNANGAMPGQPGFGPGNLVQQGRQKADEKLQEKDKDEFSSSKGPVSKLNRPF